MVQAMAVVRNLPDPAGSAKVVAPSSPFLTFLLTSPHLSSPESPLLTSPHLSSPILTSLHPSSPLLTSSPYIFTSSPLLSKVVAAPTQPGQETKVT